ncbi:MAG: acetyl-CoA C-acyltransferase [Woeseiaceae bacterium]|nr:acetyl-CoA C-acyltransferase [Woeseiaceae bacterium]
MPDVFIFDALRTPRGKGRPPKDDKPGGALSAVRPHQLVAGLIEALEGRNPGMADRVACLTLGCVGQVGAQGGHIALVSRLASRLSDGVPAKSLNNFCVSGLTAVADAAMRIRSGETGLQLAGGVESLSQVGFLADKADYYSDVELMRAIRWAPPVMGAELIATLEGFSKPDLDAVTLLSHQRAHGAWQNGAYAASVEPVLDAAGDVLLDRDELVRGELTADALAAMPPAFAEQGAMGFDAAMLAEHRGLEAINHVHSIANCPGMADGAALLLLGPREAGEAAGLEPRAKIVAMAETADDPVLQLTAGFKAMERLMAEAGVQIGDFDRIEFMEAFAAVPLKFGRDYGPDPDKVNVNGGHLAMGHPMGATGAILLTTLVHGLAQCDGELGLVVAQAGGGIGSAMIVERV